MDKRVKKYKSIDDEIIYHIKNEINTENIVNLLKKEKVGGIKSIVTNNNPDIIFINNYKAKSFTAKNNEIMIKRNKK